MGADEDKQRASSAREQRRLRATLGEEPSSSYAYHDEARVEHVRTPSSGKPANDTGPAAGARIGKPTMLGGHQAPLSPEKMAQQVSPAIRAAVPRVPRRPNLSEPPEIGSWPPLPNVPDDLEDAATPAATLDAAPGRVHADVFDAPTDPPKRTHTSTGPSGAIWSATPSVVGLASNDDGLSRYSDEPPAVDEDIGRDTGHWSNAAQVTPALGVRTADSELSKLEQLVARGAWEDLAKLGADADSSALRRLIRVIALRETLPTDAKGAARLTQDGIAALAALLGVAESSPIALTLAKRLLRRNPVWTQSQPATGLSASIVVIGLLVGCGLGWWLTRFVM